jgi:hypothetical protein
MHVRSRKSSQVKMPLDDSIERIMRGNIIPYPAFENTARGSAVRE